MHGFGLKIVRHIVENMIGYTVSARRGSIDAGNITQNHRG